MVTTSASAPVLSFEFTLRPLDEIHPWGNNTPNIHWFGLTDGCYWINMADEQIYRSSDAILDHWQSLQPDSPRFSPYVEYPVVRLWEDLLQIIPYALDQVPADLARIVDNNAAWEIWQKNARQWTEAGADDDPENRWDTFDMAVSWWSNRKLCAGHLRFGPWIWFWRVDDMVSVRWDCLSRNEDGIPVWQAQAGELSLPVSEFVQVVTTFDQRLIAEMRSRIDAARAGGLRPDVIPDIDNLERDHAYRATCMPAMLKAAPFRDYDWDDVRAAIARIDCEMRKSIQVEV